MRDLLLQGDRPALHDGAAALDGDSQWRLEREVFKADAAALVGVDETRAGSTPIVWDALGCVRRGHWIEAHRVRAGLDASDVIATLAVSHGVTTIAEVHACAGQWHVARIEVVVVVPIKVHASQNDRVGAEDPEVDADGCRRDRVARDAHRRDARPGRRADLTDGDQWFVRVDGWGDDGIEFDGLRDVIDEAARQLNCQNLAAWIGWVNLDADIARWDHHAVHGHGLGGIVQHTFRQGDVEDWVVERRDCAGRVVGDNGCVRQVIAGGDDGDIWGQSQVNLRLNVANRRARHRRAGRHGHDLRVVGGGQYLAARIGDEDRHWAARDAGEAVVTAGVGRRGDWFAAGVFQRFGQVWRAVRFDLEKRDGRAAQASFSRLEDAVAICVVEDFAVDATAGHGLKANRCGARATCWQGHGLRVVGGRQRGVAWRARTDGVIAEWQVRGAVIAAGIRRDGHGCAATDGRDGHGRAADPGLARLLHAVAVGIGEDRASNRGSRLKANRRGNRAARGNVQGLRVIGGREGRAAWRDDGDCGAADGYGGCVIAIWIGGLNLRAAQAVGDRHGRAGRAGFARVLHAVAVGVCEDLTADGLAGDGHGDAGLPRCHTIGDAVQHTWSST